MRRGAGAVNGHPEMSKPGKCECGKSAWASGEPPLAGVRKKLPRNLRNLWTASRRFAHITRWSSQRSYGATIEQSSKTPSSPDVSRTQKSEIERCGGWKQTEVAAAGCEERKGKGKARARSACGSRGCDGGSAQRSRARVRAALGSVSVRSAPRCDALPSR